MTDNDTDTNPNASTGTDSSTDDKPDWWGDLDDGTREDALTDDNPERHYIRDNGRRYWVDLKEPTWQKKSSVLDDALKIKRNSRELDTTQYYRDMLEYMIADASFDHENLITFLAGARASFVEKLLEPVPDPGGATTEDEEGNSEQPSGQELKEEAASDQQTQPSLDTNAASSN